MPIEIIVASVGKSDPAFDIQTDIIFGGNGGASTDDTKFVDLVMQSVRIPLDHFFEQSNLAIRKRMNGVLTKIDCGICRIVWRTA